MGLLATWTIILLLTVHQPFGHAPDQTLDVRISLARAHATIRGQELRHPLLELCRGDDFVVLEVLELSDGQISPQPRPECFDRVQV